MSSTVQSTISTAAATMDIKTIPNAVTQAPVFPPLRTVLACTNFSSASRAAVLEAARLCKNTGGHILLLHACENKLLSFASEDGIEHLSELFCRLDGKLQNLAEELSPMGVSVETILENGNAANVILKCMSTRGIDLAVMGTHGAVGMERILCGSTAEEVLRKAQCPVMTVGPRGTHCEVGANGPVVFATDFHKSSTEAARYAAALASAVNAPLHCLHVLPLAMENRGGASIIPRVMTEALRHVLVEDRIDIKNVVYAVTYGGEISHSIVDYAKAHKAQAIVLGVQRSSWLAAHMAPHVTYRIIVTASCPVLTISSDSAFASPGVIACL